MIYVETWNGVGPQSQWTGVLVTPRGKRRHKTKPLFHTAPYPPVSVSRHFAAQMLKTDRSEPMLTVKRFH